ncbi:uncharacterized protein SPSK_07171 [Sporothrix schenckii 1099-18]|uniref:Zn(2)-C6 fungal-type domain-containing protein n=1 Tax=Sporothrix schenckii 1099-18 TaxID=1397361 RepID=A0A0F2MDE7_SPOSC|nr:uncharacterized protein SPSK_07171 [Sporothrix schenckii 1099-18]KJR87708.1 hypothetical protein SPSK_07171 [Sporothrix schenckii 1099-18]
MDDLTVGKHRPHPSSTAPARRRAKVKTGCRTCKLRKVKCDEGRPACSRCVSTGRTCEGYGIWGGGNKAATASVSPAALMLAMGQRQRQAAQSPPWPSIPPPLLNGTVAPLSAQECNWLDWFRWRTAVKLRGAFSMAFWDVLVIRASLEEPAVLHAALALSTVHRRVGGGEGMGTSSNERLAVADACSEEFTLRQYNKAIRHLTASPLMRNTMDVSSASPDIASIRIMLVACMLFTCLEFMRGHFRTGSTHLQNGVRLLDYLYAGKQKTSPTLSTPSLNSLHLVRDRCFPGNNIDPIDQWLLEAFARMNLLAAQFGHGYARSMLPTVPQYFFSPDHHLLTLPITFASISQARNSLDALVYDVLSLKGQSQDLHKQPNNDTYSSDSLLSNGGTTSSSSASSPLPLPSSDVEIKRSLALEQARLVAALDAWHATYQASRVSLYSQPDVDLLARVAYQMLVLYYDMASILASTCLAPDTELAFDAHAGRFLAIVRNALLFIRAVKDVHNSQDVHFSINPEVAEQLGSATSPIVCLFNADVGWTPPLYFTALHCRVPRIRKQAVRFVKSIPSREGLWDSQLASAVAEKVIRLETLEGKNAQDEPNASPPTFLDSELFESNDPMPSLVPLSLSAPRIHNVHVVLPDSWSGTMTMTCEKRWVDGRCEVIQTAFDPPTKQWLRT